MVGRRGILTLVGSVGLGVLLSGISWGQGAPPTAGSGTIEILRGMLQEYARAQCGTGAGEKDPRRAEAVEKKLREYDWKDLPVALAVLGFARDQERKLRDREAAPWAFDCLPRSVAQLVPPGQWRTLIEQGVEEQVKSLGFSSWKKLVNRKIPGDVFIKARAFEKVTSCVLQAFSRGEAAIGGEDLERIRNALHRIYGTYHLQTPQASWDYSLLPAGWYLQFGAWMGDLRALSVASSMVDAWLANPREPQIKNLEQAVVAIDGFSVFWSSDLWPVKTTVLQRIRESPQIPGSIKANLKTKP